MLSVAFHTRSRDGPNRVRQIHFVPLRSENLSRPRSGQDGKLKCSRRNTVARTKLSNECSDVAVGQRRKMLGLRNLTAGGEHLSEVIFPTRRVLAPTIAANTTPIQHGFDPSAHLRHRYGLCRPVRLKGAQYFAGADIRDGEISEHRIGEGFERSEKVVARLLFAPPRLMY